MHRMYSGKTSPRPLYCEPSAQFTTGATLCTEVGDPITPTGANGEKLFITFTYVNYIFTFMMSLQTLSEIVTALESTIQYVHTSTGVPPLLIHSDNSQEYFSTAVASFMAQNGTNICTSIPHNPEENGIAESINSTLLNGVRCVQNTAKLVHAYWTYSIQDIYF